MDARVGNALIEVKFGVDALRTIRTSLMQVAYPLSEDPVSEGFVVLVDSPITMERLRDEWERAATVLRDDVLRRLTICLQQEGRFTGIPHDPDANMQRILAEVVESERGKATTTRTDYSFVIFKLLLHRWFTGSEAVTAEWLARTAGCSYPAVARALRPLGSLLERSSDRRVALRWFPKDEFARLLANADRARSTVRFLDQSGQPRSAESQLRRLEKVNPPGLAIGGIREDHSAQKQRVGSMRPSVSGRTRMWICRCVAGERAFELSSAPRPRYGIWWGAARKRCQVRRSATMRRATSFGPCARPRPVGR